MMDLDKEQQQVTQIPGIEDQGAEMVDQAK